MGSPPMFHKLQKVILQHNLGAICDTQLNDTHDLPLLPPLLNFRI